MSAPINLTPNSSSDGVTVYPQSSSLTVVVTKRRRKNTTIKARTIDANFKAVIVDTHVT